MNAGLMKMIVPSLLKLGDSPEVKAKLIELIKAKKYETLESYAEEESLTVEDLAGSEVVLQVRQISDDIIMRVQLIEQASGTAGTTLATYHYEDIVKAVKNIL